MKKKITFISDTHTKHNQITNDLLKDGGDILIHAGDFMNAGYNPMEAIQFFQWYDKIDNYDTKIFIAGNHDLYMQNEPEEVKGLLTGYKTIEYLMDEDMSIYDMDEDTSIKIYGSPWSPWFYDWAFNLPRNGSELYSKWGAIPDDTDILITHGPPYGYLDIPGGQNIRVG
jgi:3',5'-cyclic AMP phosphodiesterase CpdA